MNIPFTANDENGVTMELPRTPMKHQPRKSQSAVQNHPLHTLQERTPLTPTSTTNNINNGSNKRKRTSFNIYSDKKRSVLSFNNADMTEQHSVIRTISHDNSSDMLTEQIEELRSEMTHIQTRLHNSEADVQEYKKLYEMENSLKVSHEKELIGMRAQCKYFKETVDKLRAELVLKEKEKGKLLEQVKEGEDISDHWQKKFKEQQSNLHDKFEMYKNLREQSKEMELEMARLRAINTDLEQRLLKKTEEKKVSEQTTSKKTLKKSSTRSAQPVTANNSQLTAEFEKLREEYECIKAANDVFRDERNSLEELAEKNRLLAENIRAQNNDLQEQVHNQQYKIENLSSSNTYLTTQFNEISSRYSSAEAELAQLNQRLKQERQQFVTQLEDLEKSYKHSQLSDRYKELLLINSEYKRQADTVDVVLENMDKALMVCSDVAHQADVFQSHLIQVASMYQADLQKARENMQEYKNMCLEAEKRLAVEIQQSLNLTTELSEAREQEMSLAAENMRLNDYLEAQTSIADSLSQDIYMLQHELYNKVQSLNQLEEMLQMQTYQVNIMMDVEVPQLQDAVIKLEVANAAQSIINNVISCQYAQGRSHINDLETQYTTLKSQKESVQSLLNQTEQDMYILYNQANSTISSLQERVQRLQNALTASDTRYNELIDFTHIEKQVADEVLEQEKNLTAQLKAQLSQLDSRFKQTSERLEHVEAQNAELVVNLQRITSENSELQSSLLTTTKELESRSEAFLVAEQEWKESERALQRDIASVRNEAEHLRIIRSSLEQEVRTSVKSEQMLREQFNREVTQYQRDLSQTRSELENLKGVVLDLEREREHNLSLQLALNQIEGKLRHCQYQLEQTEKERSQVETTLEQTQSSLSQTLAQNSLLTRDCQQQRDEIEHISKARLMLQEELQNQQNNHKSVTEKYYRDLSENMCAKFELEKQLKDKNFELVRYRGQNSQLALELETLLAKTQKSDWLQDVDTAVFDLSVARRDVQQLSIQVTTLSEQVNDLNAQNMSLKKELNERIYMFAERERIISENMIRVENECKYLATVIEGAEETLSQLATINEHPSLVQLLKNLHAV